MRRAIIYRAYSTVVGTMSPPASLSQWLTQAAKGQMILDGSLIMLEYSGFSDIALRPLFEGDVIESSKGVRHVIEFDKDRGEWCWFPDCDNSKRRFGQAKLIGNVYQNPNLKIAKEAGQP